MFSSVLAIEIEDNILRAAVIKRRFHKYVVEQCHALALEEPEEDRLVALPTLEKLQQLLMRIGKLPSKVVVVSHQGTMVNVFIPSIRVKKLRAYQLKEMLRWEVEPYTGLSAPEILVGYEINQKNIDNQHEIRVATFAQADYQGIKELLSQVKAKLRRVYLPEFCFPLAAIFTQVEQQERLMVVSVGRQNSRVALVENGQVIGYRIVLLGYQAIKMYMDGLPDETLLDTMREALTWDTLSDLVIGRVICGPGAADEQVIEFFKKQLGLPVETVQFSTAAAADEPVGAEFATVIGAGLRELGFAKAKQGVGIDDRIPLVKLISEHVHFFPIAVGAGIVILFLGHYAYLLYQVKQVETQIEEQTAKLEEIKAATERYEKLNEQISQLNEKEKLAEKKLLFLESGTEGKEQPVQMFLGFLSQKVPKEITLHTVKPLEGNRYLITGESMTVASINALALTMQNQPWCYYARVESITRNENIKTIPSEVEGVEPTKIEIISYEFKLMVNFEKYDTGGE
ncbi:PilN domain-containing protein [Peptococcaceae bacterium]|nr:PilN domain-containing protein [Peptococcaceae bacterium]